MRMRSSLNIVRYSSSCHLDFGFWILDFGFWIVPADESGWLCKWGIILFVSTNKFACSVTNFIPIEQLALLWLGIWLGNQLLEPLVVTNHIEIRIGFS